MMHTDFTQELFNFGSSVYTASVCKSM